MTFNPHQGRSDYDHVAGLSTRLLEIAQNLQDVCADLPLVWIDRDEQRLQRIINHLTVDALKLAMQSAGVTLAFRRDRRLAEVAHQPAEGRWSDGWDDYEPQHGGDIPRISDHAPWRERPALGPAKPWAPWGNGVLVALDRDPEIALREDAGETWGILLAREGEELRLAA